MQQANQIKDPVKPADSVPSISTGEVTNSFVINLCSSTSPVSLAPPDHAGLKRFTFFVSRRREDGRERFRLHMGYFSSQEEAEKLLDIVREIYPGAWAGMAPGQRLRSAAADAARRAAASPQPPISAALADPIPAAAPAPIAAAEPADLSLAEPLVLAEPAAVAEPAMVATTTAATEPPASPLPAMPIALALADVPAADLAATPLSDDDTAAQSLSDVRAAIASLDDREQPAAPRAPVLRIPELKPAPVSSQAAAASAKPVDTSETLSGERAIALLESGQRLPALPAAGAAPSAEKPAYAVQLIWSVQPIDATQIPQLAIFNAYTLYGAEGQREGRRWYGLRLGFFTDAVSAKQVAHYVRSEFSTVSVVPVTPRERERAGQVAIAKTVLRPTTVPAIPVPANVPKLAAAKGTVFEFIDDKLPPGMEAEAGVPARGAPGKRAKQRRTLEAAKPRKLTLEETLEILGAGDLSVDNGRGELLNDEAAAGPATEKQKKAKAKASRLGRLLERLSERIGS